MNFRRLFLIATPYFWLLALFLVPFLIVFKISLSDTAIAIPPMSRRWRGSTPSCGHFFYSARLTNCPTATSPKHCRFPKEPSDHDSIGHVANCENI